MDRQSAAILDSRCTYDDCLIMSCLKSLFRRTDKAAPAFVISDRIADIKKELEQLNVQGAAELTYPYLAAMEASMPNVAFRYAVIYKNDRPVLFAYFQLFSLSAQNFDLHKNKSFVKGLFSFFLKLKKIKVLVSGNALRNETLCYCFKTTDLDNETACEAIASVAEKIAADEHATAIILKDVPQAAGIAVWLTGIGYQQPWKDHLMVMDIDPGWKTMADYVSALSRKYKTRANKILAAGSSIAIKELEEADILKHGKAINKLFRKVTDNQPFVLTRPGDNHFALLKNVYGEGFEFLGFFRGNELVAFYSAFVTAEVYELYYAGFDYDHNNDYQLYFNILFSGLERAILLNKKQLKLGRTSFDAKASLGAKAVEMNYYIKTANIPAAVINWFTHYFSTMEDGRWKQRNPLK